jgi:hypothetical protein
MRMNLGFMMRVHSPSVIAHFESLGYKVRDLPKTRCVSSQFPMTLQHVSYYLGASKFYPKLREHMKNNEKKYGGNLLNDSVKAASLEYTKDGMINYYFPLER